MSVMKCDRNNCENICCNRYSHNHGYLCNSCFEELVKKGNNYSIIKFMVSDAPQNDFDSEEARRHYNSIFKSVR